MSATSAFRFAIAHLSSVFVCYPYAKYRWSTAQILTSLACIKATSMPITSHSPNKQSASAGDLDGAIDADQHTRLPPEGKMTAHTILIACLTNLSALVSICTVHIKGTIYPSLRGKGGVSGRSFDMFFTLNQRIHKHKISVAQFVAPIFIYLASSLSPADRRAEKPCQQHRLFVLQSRT